MDLDKAMTKRKKGGKRKGDPIVIGSDKGSPKPTKRASTAASVGRQSLPRSESPVMPPPSKGSVPPAGAKAKPVTKPRIKFADAVEPRQSRVGMPRQTANSLKAGSEASGDGGKQDNGSEGGGHSSGGEGEGPSTEAGEGTGGGDEQVSKRAKKGTSTMVPSAVRETRSLTRAMSKTPQPPSHGLHLDQYERGTLAGDASAILAGKSVEEGADLGFEKDC